MKKREIIVTLIPCIVVVAALIFLICIPPRHHRKSGDNDGDSNGNPGEVIRMAIDPAVARGRENTLTIGYCYSTMEKFARHLGKSADIFLARADSCLTALEAGEIDMMAIPVGRALPSDNKIIVSSPVDGLFQWVMRSSDYLQMEKADIWINRYFKSEAGEINRDRFLNRKGSISPYDSLIRIYAKRIGWDWRLFAAVIYQESFFHIEAKSYAGARGLCQLMPGTAAALGVTNILDPEQNIRGGAEYLRKIKYHMRGYDDDEQLAFTLAAFNAGEGRLQDMQRFTEDIGLDPHDWEDVKTGILYMNADSFPNFDVDDTLYLKNENKRNWTETAYYVGNITSKYRSYLKMSKGK